jgi:hypothetical protein
MLTDVLGAPLAERPGMMLRLLGEALSRVHRLPPADGMTANNLVRQARLDAETQRANLANVAGVSERARYAAQTPGDEQLEAAVSSARELLTAIARTEGVGS